MTRGAGGASSRHHGAQDHRDPGAPQQDPAAAGPDENRQTVNGQIGRRLAAAGVALASLALAAAPAAATGSTPSPTPGAGKVITVPADTITFAVATSNGRTNDGRTSFAFESKPGKVLRDSVIVYNLGKVKATLALYPIDGITAADGTFSLAQLTDHQKAFGRWARLSRNVVVLPGGSSVVVPFTVTVPANANPGDVTGGIVVSDVPRRPDVTSVQQQLAVATRIGIRTVVRVQGQLRASLSVDQVTSSFEPNLATPGFGRLTVSWRVTNTGNVGVGAKQAVDVSMPFGLAVASSTPAKLSSILPGDSVVQTSTFDNVFAGVRLTSEVTATPVVLEGQVPDAAAGAASDSIWAVSWIAVGIVTLIVALIVWLVLRLRARGRGPTESVDTPRHRAPATVGSGVSS